MSYEKPKQLTSWSFSRWSTYSECPRKAKYKFLDKLEEPSSPALERGTQLHQLCEWYLRGAKKTVPKEVKPIAKYLQDLRKEKAIAEAEFTFTRDWKLTKWNDWNNAWVRIKADSLVPPIADADRPIVKIDDFKSGGKLDSKTEDVVFKEEYPLQLELYDLAALLAYPTAAESKSRLIFIDHGKAVESDISHVRTDVPKLMKRWETRTKKMLTDTKFKPTPGNACRWCHFRQANGGPCEY